MLSTPRTPRSAWIEGHTVALDGRLFQQHEQELIRLFDVIDVIHYWGPGHYSYMLARRSLGAHGNVAGACHGGLNEGGEGTLPEEVLEQQLDNTPLWALVERGKKRVLQLQAAGWRPDYAQHHRTSPILKVPEEVKQPLVPGGPLLPPLRLPDAGPGNSWRWWQCVSWPNDQECPYLLEHCYVVTATCFGITGRGVPPGLPLEPLGEGDAECRGIACLKPKTPGFRSAFNPKVSITWRGRLNGPNHAGPRGRAWLSAEELAAANDGVAA